MKIKLRTLLQKKKSNEIEKRSNKFDPTTTRGNDRTGRETRLERFSSSHPEAYFTILKIGAKAYAFFIVFLLGLCLWLTSNLFIFGEFFPDPVSDSDLRTTVDVNPVEYHIGEEGKITITLENVSNVPLNISAVTFNPPSGFFQGFIIKYPTEPPLNSDSEWFYDFIENLGEAFGDETKLERVTTFDGKELGTNETFIIQIPIVANSSRDCSGIFSVTSTISTESKKSGDLLYSVKFNIIILP
ncbi:MAG: hypothetical protein ACOYZ6_15090 [Chloroflexota bacterium]